MRDDAAPSPGDAQPSQPTPRRRAKRIPPGRADRLELPVDPPAPKPPRAKRQPVPPRVAVPPPAVWAPTPVVGAAPKARGNPRKFTPTRQAEYLHYLSRGMRRSKAAAATGVSLSTVKAARDIDPKFAEAEELAEVEAAEVIEDALWETARAGNVTAQIYYLGNRSKDRWKDVRNTKTVVEHTGKVTNELEAGSRMERIALISAQLQERAALRGAPLQLESSIIDADVVDETEEAPQQ